MKTIKRWLCMLLVVSIVGGCETLESENVPDDNMKD